MASTTSSTDPRVESAETVEATRPAAIGTLIEVHPDHLAVDPANVRKDNAEPSAELLQSVAEVGVREPIGVRSGPGGAFWVFKGQRRMLAAQAAAAKARKNGEPVRLVPAILDELDEEADAVLFSLVENKHREEMTARDDVNAVSQLSLLTDDNIARRTRAANALGLTPDQVMAAQRARQLTPKSLTTATASGYDLEQMGDLVEVEKVPNATTVLDQAKKDDERTGGRGHWEHAMSRLRGDLGVIERAAAVRAELGAAKIKIVSPQPYYSGYGEKPKDRELSELRTQLGGPVLPEKHAGCPGHAARIDRATGEAVFLCLDPVAHGHKVPKKAAKPRSEQEKARHASVVAHNRAWRDARPVRHKFIAELVARPKVSEAVQLFCLSHLLHQNEGSSRYADRGELAYAAGFLGVPEPKTGRWNKPFQGAITKAMKGRRSANLLFAHVAAVVEFDMGDRAWEDGSAQVKEWLRLLAAEGYTLSEVEAEITGPLRGPAAKGSPKSPATARTKLATAA
ncbi:ParB/RepB/Spo0J family partition protein [Streptacidiphilus jiangxiensis]|uniref:ParB/RepB/Spo0J family partition protein n=1 Tax=Streptacidiphilus jiangxiensis TaxID=235985 RepID=A0A1H8AHM4_STRJI|nr:ParB N-terminal domain-containing protein [Streptacidiphilus jiangxiensis]SEM70302.1 ParB/RepB/Spo0J family partition protein [Streptacidiphilus jiangxiensis]